MRERAGGMSVDVQSEVRRQNNSFGTHRSSHGTGTGISGLEMRKDRSPSVLPESARSRLILTGEASWAIADPARRIAQAETKKVDRILVSNWVCRLG